VKLFGVGDEKTGTHSLAGLFSAYRAEHEPEVHDLRPCVEAHLRGELPAGTLERYFADKEERLHLEVDSSFLNGEVIDLLVPCYPDAKYVLTVREPRSWLDSKINQMVTFKSPRWIELRALRHGAPEGHPPEEAPLAERGLPTLDGFLAEYAQHNRRIVAAVRPAQLLVLRTQDIRDRADVLAAFAGVPVDSLNLERSHEFQGPVKHHVLEELDQAYLDAKIDQHCAADVLPLLEAAETA
jgi:hypothetical protein